MLASSSTTITRVRPFGAGMGAAGTAGPVPLAVGPGIDVPFAEPPLATDPNGGNFTGLDESVDRTKVDPEVFEDLFSREKHLVCWARRHKNSPILACSPPGQANLVQKLQTFSS